MSILRKALAFITDGVPQKFLGDGFHFELIGPKHTDSIVNWRNDSSNLELFVNTGNLTAELQNRFLLDYAEADRIDFILMDTLSQKPIGSFSLTKLSGTPELGKLMGEKQYRGKGLAKNATQAVLYFAAHYLDLAEIHAITRADNLTNIALNQSLGFEVVSDMMIAERKFLTMRLAIKV